MYCALSVVYNDLVWGQEEFDLSQRWKLRLPCPTYVRLLNHISVAANVIASVLSVC